MAVKAICMTACYTAKRLWNPGDVRIFPSKKDVEPCFAYSGDVVELEEGPPSKPFSQLTVDEYVELAKSNSIEIPPEVKNREDLKKFLAGKLDQK